MAHSLTRRKRAKAEPRERVALLQRIADLELLQSTVAAAGEASTVEAALQICLDRICAHARWPIGHAYRRSGTPSGELISTVWHLDDPQRFETFWKSTEATRFFPGIGLPGRVLGSGKPLWIADVTKESYFPGAPQAKATGVRAGFGVPVRVGTEVAAVLEFFSTRALEPDEPLLALVVRIADQLGGIIERARAEHQHAQFEALSKRLAQLYRLSSAIQEPLSLKDQLTRVLDTAREVVEIDRFYIWVVTPDDEKLVSLAGAGFSEEEVEPLLGVEIPLAHAGAMYKAYRERVPLLFNEQNPLPPELLLKPPYSELEAIRTKRFMVVPMIARGRRVGLLTGDNKWSGRPIPPETVEVLQVFASHAAVAVENARLFREIDEKGQQLEIASQHKSQFLANMSHELRTPLNAILGYTELILDNIYGDLTDKLRDVLQRVQRSGRHLLGLINDVLDLSKIEAGEFSLSIADYSIQEVVHTVVTAVESLAAEKGLALRIAVPPDLPPGKGDERRIAQVLLNVVGNAIKFTEAGEVVVRVMASDGKFLVAVSDTGPGISEADQERIFEEFQQVDTSSTRPKGGAGLGLSIAKRIIEMHHGRIWVESTLGSGSTFSFIFPVRVEKFAGA